MHMLHLLRHAKARTKDDRGDHERALNRRGREAARRVGKSLPAAVGTLDLALSSSAARTRETLDLVLAEFPSRPRCLIEDGLYLAGRDRLMARLRRLDEANTSVLLVGHDPGIHELAIVLADPDSPQAQALTANKFPTAARASFCIDAPWPALGSARYRLVDYVIPDSLLGGKA
ncbi:MAG TPA: histidine phosphatase family protein [Stellaceae bacterium]|nr:histidine phosphatase family protein [Stellaceae bacterium]